MSDRGIIDHAEEALLDLGAPLADKPRIAGLVRAVCAPKRTWEDTAADLAINTRLTTIVAEQAPARNHLLDRVGRVVGEDRGELDDADYRRALQARSLINRTAGEPWRLTEVCRLLTGAVQVRYTPYHPAEFGLQFVLRAPLSAAARRRTARRVRDAMPAGVTLTHLTHVVHAPDAVPRVYYCGFADDPDAGGFADDFKKPGILSDDIRHA